MNLIETQIEDLNKEPFRPKNWAEKVQNNLSKKKINKSISSIYSVFAGRFFNEKIAIEIITVFNKEKKRQQDLLKSL